MTLTILADNRPNPVDSRLEPVHGFAVFANLENRSVLYDFGDKDTLLENARILGIDLSQVDLAVLSHGHYDHSGDLHTFLEINRNATIYHGRGAFHPRWSISKGPARDIGVPLKLDDDIVARLSAVDSRFDQDDFIVLPAAPGFSRRPAANDLLLAGSEGARMPDEFTDELSILFRTEDGIVVVTGCSHRGILNIVDQVRTYCPECPIRALVGGFHLLDNRETDDDLQRIADKLAQDLPDAVIAPGHCTEEVAMGVLSEVFGDRFDPLYVGKAMTF